MATILYPDGHQEQVQPANGRDFQLAELKAIVGHGAPVGGDHIEIIRIRDDEEHILVANEESKLLDLPRNEKATQIAGLPTPEERAAMMAYYRAMGVDVISGPDPDEEDYIAGCALYCRSDEVR